LGSGSSLDYRCPGSGVLDAGRLIKCEEAFVSDFTRFVLVEATTKEIEPGANKEKKEKKSGFSPEALGARVSFTPDVFEGFTRCSQDESQTLSTTEKDRTQRYYGIRNRMHVCHSSIFVTLERRNR